MSGKHFCTECGKSDGLSATCAARQDEDGGWYISSDPDDEISYCDHCEQEDPETEYREEEEE